MIPGTGAHTLTVTSPTGAVKPLDVGVLICFESAFPDMSRVETDQGAQLIVYQSSTPTFQGTWGPDQHASLAAIRAAETGRPVVQAALTGDTVAFDARGRQIAWLGQDSRGVITVTLDLPAQAAKTFYDQAGDYVMWSGVGHHRARRAGHAATPATFSSEYHWCRPLPVRQNMTRIPEILCGASAHGSRQHGPPGPDEVAGEGEPRLTQGGTGVGLRRSAGSFGATRAVPAHRVGSGGDRRNGRQHALGQSACCPRVSSC